MRLTLNALARHLKDDLAGAYFVFGAEPLLIEETCDAIRRTAREAGYEERLRFTIDSGFDWGDLTELSMTQSLFAMRRIVEIRLPATRVGDAIAKLMDLVTDPPDDTLVMLIGAKIEKKSQSAKWFKSIEDASTTIDCPEVPARQMIKWLTDRLSQAELTPEEGVVERMAWFLEGNLLAAAQEIERLKLLNTDGKITLDIVEESLSDHARFNVYSWVDALLAGRVERGLRILGGLRREGTAPVVTLWALAREVRVITGIATDVAAGMTVGKAVNKAKVWSSRERLIKHALKRFDAAGWQRILREIAYADRILKGRGSLSAGVVDWDELERLSMRVCAADIKTPLTSETMPVLRRAAVG